MTKQKEHIIREMISILNILSVCDDWDFGARFRCSFNRNDGRQLANIQMKNQRSPHLEFGSGSVYFLKLVDNSYGIL